MEPTQNEEEIAKLKVKEAIGMFKKEMKKNKDARFWCLLLAWGFRLKFWKLEDSLEDVSRIMEDFGRSFEEKLSYVV